MAAASAQDLIIEVDFDAGKVTVDRPEATSQSEAKASQNEKEAAGSSADHQKSTAPAPAKKNAQVTRIKELLSLMESAYKTFNASIKGEDDAEVTPGLRRSLCQFLWQSEDNCHVFLGNMFGEFGVDLSEDFDYFGCLQEMKDSEVKEKISHEAPGLTKEQVDVLFSGLQQINAQRQLAKKEKEAPVLTQEQLDLISKRMEQKKVDDAKKDAELRSWYVEDED